jgi:hypothetical protein
MYHTLSELVSLASRMTTFCVQPISIAASIISGISVYAR